MRPQRRRTRPRGTAAADADGGLARRPGLLLEWRHDTADGWTGLVVYVPAETGSGVCLVVQQWLPAAQLTARP